MDRKLTDQDLALICRRTSFDVFELAEMSAEELEVVIQSVLGD